MMTQRIGPTNPFVEFPADAIEQSIPDRFAQQVRLHGGRLAVKDGVRALTYDALDLASNRVAHRILAERGIAEEPVALLLGHGAGVAVGILGALKAGNFFVPLDPAYPEARTRYMLEDSTASVLVTDGEHATVARRLASRAVAVIDID